MNLLCSLIYLACSVVISLSSSITHTPALDHVILTSASGEELQSAMGEELESDGATGLFSIPPLIRVSPTVSEEQRSSNAGRRRNGGRRKNKSHVTSGHFPTQVQHSFTTDTDPCRTSHREYCIHGHCTYLQDLKEPVCVCTKGYDGVRCGIQLLQTFSGTGSGSEDLIDHTHSLQLVLIIIAVVLSIISCFAIIIIITVQYKSQRGFQAAFLSSSSEREKLQKNLSV
ncbi:proheparin-binding EGF-like growth factor [Hoplias malabaricus]|uniref:proheparin-binding EGF-like growth factor n=1 Tax=Hoplias malabaricus TaxID=27720 RepID=UPI003462D9E2